MVTFSSLVHKSYIFEDVESEIGRYETYLF